MYNLLCVDEVDLPTPGGQMAKTRGFEKSLQPFFKTISVVPETTDNCRIHYYQ
jgi:hypothetical protein